MPVVFAAQAATDLEDILQYIAGRSSSPVIARDFVAGIIAHCRKLALFPRRGTKRDDLRPGIRTIGYRRRATIAFKNLPSTPCLLKGKHIAYVASITMLWYVLHRRTSH